MLTAFIAILMLAMGLVSGYFSRELSDRLRRIERAVQSLYAKQAEAPKKHMSFGEPMSMQDFQEMEENARIDALNE